MSEHTCGLRYCDKPIFGNGPVCKMHYERHRMTGNYGPHTSRRIPKPPEVLFWERVTPGTADECWPWQGSMSEGGYGQLSHGGRSNVKRVAAHRLAYELLVGPIPEGLVLDHLCRNRACVNPAHLEPVTIAENVRRGEAPTIQLWRENRCKRGHEFTPENTYRPPGRPTQRHCRACIAIREQGEAK